MEELINFLDEGIIGLNENLEIFFINKRADHFLNILQEDLSFDILKKFARSVQKKNKIYKKNLVDEKRDIYFQMILTPRNEKRGVYVLLIDKSHEHKLLQVGKDFVCNASHELKTPLTIIKGFSETLKDFSSLPKDMVSQVIDKIIRTSDRLDRIIHDLLMLAKLDNLKLDNFAKCDFKKILCNTKEMIATIYPHARIDLTFPSDDLFVWGVEGLLEIVIKNILENSIRYCKKKPRIALKLIPYDKHLELQLKDNGIGISKKDIPLIFNRFFTVDRARSKKFGGTGLGLSLVKNIISKHKGSIKVFSELNKGTVIKIRLKLFR